ncbi:Angio-associated migratory cell protein [Nymphon striatum]|nr:Angio-associated migratory cell protein [Nymphon striatum]
MDDNCVDEDEIEQDLSDVEEVFIEEEDDDDDDDFQTGAEYEAIPIEDDSKVIFSSHSASVFCCDIDKYGLHSVTGGEDDKAYVWDIKTGDVVMECAGHTDSIVFVKFNFDSTLLATGDMSGKIKIWKSENRSEILSLETADLKWMQWHHSANVLFAGAADGFMWMWKIPSGECKSFFGPGRACETGVILADGSTAVCGYEDGTLKFWNLRTGQVLHSISDLNSHRDSVICLDCDTTVTVATGSNDGTSKLISSKSGKVLTTLECSTSEANNSVESVAFCPNHPLLATGTVSGHLGIWDLTKQVNRYNKRLEDGITKVMWDKNQACGSLLYTAGLDGIVRLWDARTGENEMEWKGHTESILDMVLFNDSILTTSDDQTARVFSVQR